MDKISLHGSSRQHALESFYLRQSALFSHLEDRVKFDGDYPSEITMGLTEKSANGSMMDNHAIDSGWTYFGQFLAHDLTYHQNFGGLVPRLNLDVLYGMGPRSSTYLYEMHQNRDSTQSFRGVRFLLDPYLHPTGEKVNDVFRVGRLIRTPLMGDTRNDENFILSQLHCAFLCFHNRIAEAIAKYGNTSLPDELFAKTRTFVTHTYQWIIINKYLKLGNYIQL